MSKRVVCCILSLVMVLTFVPFQAYAQEEDLVKKDFLSEESVTTGVGCAVSVESTVTANNVSLSEEGIVSFDNSLLPADSIELTANSVGEVIVTVFADDGMSYDTLSIIVKPAPQSISLSATTSKLGAGEIYAKLKASVEPADSYCPIEWSSDNENVATVDDSGIISAVSKGSVNITASSYNGVSAVYKFSVFDAPTNADLNLGNSNIVIGLGDTYSFPLSFKNSTYWYSRTFISSNSNIVSVDGSKITAKSVGSATVTLRLNNGSPVTKTCKVTVVSAPTLIKINPSVKLGAGETFKLSPSFTPSAINTLTYTYKSSNTAVATVNNGTIRGVRAGKCVVKNTAYNNITSNDCNVTVYSAPTKVSLNKKTLTLGKGETYNLKAVFPKNTYSNSLTYTTSKSSVVKVSASGKVTAVNLGTATIKVRTYNGKTATCKITVKKAPSKISLNRTKLVLGVGEKFDLNSSVPSGCASYSRKWISSNKSVLSVNTSGIVVANKVGTAKVIVRTFNGKARTCTITVKRAPRSIKLSVSSKTVLLHNKYALKAKLSSGSASNVIRWSTSNKKVATVTSGGIVKGVGTGTCYITVKTYNGRSARCKIKVKRGKYSYLVSSYTTTFPLYTNVGKPKNLKLACKYINGKSGGKVVKSGDIFSFNKVVGKRTAKRGFVDAYITAGYSYTNGMGGGVCQAATTIFDAAFYGNFKIVERSCHALKSSYCPVGMDAAIYWGSQDMKFKNNYSCAIKVKMIYNSSGSITCKIYSNKKIKLKKVKSKVTYSNGVYTTKRYYGKKCNYTTYSRYND